jgi:hypothetical protein
VSAVKIPADIHVALADLWSALAREGIYPSDRRLNSCLSAMQAEAYRAGREEVSVDDMTLLPYVLRWAKPDQLPKLQRLVYAVSSPYDLRALDLSDKIDKMSQEYEQLLTVADVPNRKRGMIGLHVKVSGDRKTGRTGIGHDLKKLRESAAADGRQVALYAPLAARAKALGQRILDTLESMEVH